MDLYFIICAVMCVIGVLMLAIGASMKDRLPPRVAAMLILAGVVIAMIFMNLTLVLQLARMNG